MNDFGISNVVYFKIENYLIGTFTFLYRFHKYVVC